MPIVRPSWLALHRKTLLGLVTMSTIGALGVWYLDRKPPAPTKTVVQAVPSIVTVPITTPAPVVNVTVQPPLPPVEPPVETPPPRALAPFLDAMCLARTDYAEPEEGVVARRCSWDDGFPAISADGKTIALRYSRDDGGRGWLNIAVQFIDAETSKVIADHAIVAPEDLDEEGEPTDKTRALVVARVAPIQKRLDAGAFRALQPIVNAISEGASTPPGMRIEHDQFGAAVRVVDGETNTVVWRGEFAASTEYRPRKIDPDSDSDSDCYPSSTNSVIAWFDPATRLIAFQVSYGSGPCYCGDEIHHYVRRAATP